jgi:serine/threonine protein kinase
LSLSIEHRGVPLKEVIAGTLAYMAPEQTGRMHRSVDSRSDLYALGVTFYEMLTGQLSTPDQNCIAFRSKGASMMAVSCLDVYGPRPIATVFGKRWRSQLPTYMRRERS